MLCVLDLCVVSHGVVCAGSVCGEPWCCVCWICVCGEPWCCVCGINREVKCMQKFFGKYEGKKPLGTYRCTSEGKIKVELFLDHSNLLVLRSWQTVSFINIITVRCKLTYGCQS